MTKASFAKKQALEWAGDNWYRSTQDPLPDEIIDAFEDGYKKGHMAGREEIESIISNKLKDNLLRACKVSESIFESFEKKGISCYRMSVRSEGITNFNTLIIVDRDKYLAKEGKWMYRQVRETRKKQSNSDFNITFTLMPNADSIDDLSIACDGYFMTYAPKAKKK